MSEGLTPISTLVDGAPAEIIRKRPGGHKKPRGEQSNDSWGRLSPTSSVTQDDPVDPRTLEDWLTLPVDFRDDFAARAMYEEWGNHKKAAARLGFAMRDARKLGAKRLTSQETAERARILTEVFDTPGVRERLSRTFANVMEEREAVVLRLKKIALSADDEHAVRAAQTLAKMEGWNKEVPPAPSQANLTITLASLVGGAALSGDSSTMKRVTTIDQQTKNAAALGTTKTRATIDDILAHEPGAPSPFGTQDEGVGVEDDA